MIDTPALDRLRAIRPPPQVCADCGAIATVLIQHGAPYWDFRIYTCAAHEHAALRRCEAADARVSAITDIDQEED